MKQQAYPPASCFSATKRGRSYWVVRLRSSSDSVGASFSPKSFYADIKAGHEETKELADRLLFCRVTLLFGWTGNEAIAGGRICVMGVMAG